MRDFHSNLRNTPFLDNLRKKSIFIPMGRGQSHNQFDSLNAEITGAWTSRYTNSVLTEDDFTVSDSLRYPKTMIEYFQDSGYQILTQMKYKSPNYDKEKKFFSYQEAPDVGSVAATLGMRTCWLKKEVDRQKQFELPHRMSIEEWVNEAAKSKNFYAHIILRDTHRPWGQRKALGKLGKQGPTKGWPEDAAIARKIALTKPDEFAALRRRGLEMADQKVRYIFEQTKHLKNTAYLVYSNHGEVFDHFRYNQPYQTHRMILNGHSTNMIGGTSHGLLPYETVYANMQMWIIPGMEPKVISGIGRSIDITPTTLDLASISHAEMDGESMLAYFRSGEIPHRDRYAEAFNGKSAGVLSMVRGDGFKFIWGRAGIFKSHAPAVFDLRSDPYEYVNLLKTPKGQEILKWAIQTHASLKK